MFAIHNTEDHTIRVFKDNGKEVTSFDDGFPEGAEYELNRKGYRAPGKKIVGGYAKWAQITANVWAIEVGRVPE